MDYSQRLSRLRARMQSTQTDMVVLGPSSHMVWLSGLSPHGDERPVMLVVTQSFAGLLMPSLNADSSRAVTDLPFYTWTDADGPDAALAQLLDDADAHRKGLKIGLDETMRADFALLVLDALPEVAREFTEPTIGALRAQKDDGEYRALKANALIDDVAMRAGFAACKPGVTELDIVQVINDAFKANGAAPEFNLVCFGENGAFPHHHSGNRVLKPNDTILLDIGGRKDGYPSDMTRVGTIGRPDPEFAKVWGVVNEAVKAAVAAARPGVPASAVDKAARDVITAAGYGEYFLHRTGHGLGIDVHEPPYITGTSERLLEEGNVFSIEPGVYLAGRFGLRLEEVVILRKDHAEILSEMPREAVVVG
ncbi:MAG: Xaa-Pro peptidase family protein [Devosia sp.]|nr:Xaa-Pro peptidase family protein [Devosia sp.]